MEIILVHDEGYRYAPSHVTRALKQNDCNWQSEHQCRMGSHDPRNRWVIQVPKSPVDRCLPLDKPLMFGLKCLMALHLGHQKLHLPGSH